MTGAPTDVFELVPPGGGRHFTGGRVVRLSDVLPSGLARLDALARYLHDVAADDSADAGVDAHLGLAWVVRKTALELRRRPRLGEALELDTWASASGARWAERRTTIRASGDAIVEAASLWVCVDASTLRPARLPAQFWAIYGEAAAGRVVTSRLRQPELQPELTVAARAWPLRLSDLDVLDHVNNAVSWAAVEEEAARVVPGAVVERAELEYQGPIDRDRSLAVVSQVDGPTVQVWLAAEGSVLVSGRLTMA